MNPPKYCKLYLTILLFLFSLSFFLFLTQNLPYEMAGWDDQLYLFHAKTTGVTSLLNDFFTRRPQPELANQWGLHERITLVFIFKIAYLLGGLNPAVHYFIRGLFFSMVCIFIFYFLYKATKRYVLSLLGSLFYMTLPQVFLSVKWLADAEIIQQFFLGISFLLFLHAFNNDLKNYRFYLFQIMIIFFSYCTLKSKENAIIIPVVLLFYILIVDYKKMRQWAILIGILFFLVSPYVLSSLGGFNENQTGSSLILEKAKAYFFYNSYSTLDTGEHQFPFFSVLQHFKSVPASVLTSLGFFGSWLFIIAFTSSIVIITLSIFLKRLELTPYGQNYWIFFFIWTFATTALMIFFITDPTNVGNNIRYVAIALFPFTLLAFSSYNILISYLEKNVSRTLYTRLALVLIFLTIILVITVNSYHTTIKIRGGLLSRHTATDEMVTLIFKDYYHLDIGESAYQVIGGNIRFCSLEPEYIPISNLVLTEINFFNVAQPVTLDNINKNLKLYNTTYLILLLKPISERNELSSVNATLLTELRPCDHNSFYCEIKNLFKKEKPFFFLYKINPEIYASSENYTVKCLDYSPF